ncbi:MAG: hypothetical protein KDD70_05090, partial [Bdellovibrionales bacterium]|nr:hypothetical protein [Bdellovibrionales bacterium]
MNNQPAILRSTSSVSPVNAQMMSGDLRYGDGSVENNQPSLKELIALFRKHYVWIVASTLLFTVGAGIYCVTADRLFSATTSIEIKGYAPILANTSIESLHRVDNRKNEEYLLTTIAKLRRPGIADRVLSQDGMEDTINAYFKSTGRGWLSPVKEFAKSVLKELPFFGEENVVPEFDEREDEHYQHSPKLIRAYLDLIDVDPIPDTSLVEIEAVTRSAKLSQKVANAHARGFIEDLQSERQESMLSNLQTLQKQGKELSEKLAQAEAELASYAEENKLIISSQDQGADLSMRKIITLTEALAKASASRMKAENLLEELRTAGPAEATTLDDDSIRPLRLELKRTLAEYQSMSKRVTDKYPGMIELKAKIESLQESIKDSRDQVFNGLDIEVKSKLAAEQSILEQLDIEKEKGYEISKLLVRYNVLRKESDSLRQLYEAVLKQV